MDGIMTEGEASASSGPRPRRGGEPDRCARAGNTRSRRSPSRIGCALVGVRREAEVVGDLQGPVVDASSSATGMLARATRRRDRRARPSGRRLQLLLSAPYRHSPAQTVWYPPSCARSWRSLVRSCLASRF